METVLCLFVDFLDGYIYIYIFFNQSLLGLVHTYLSSYICKDSSNSLRSQDVHHRTLVPRANKILVKSFQIWLHTSHCLHKRKRWRCKKDKMNVANDYLKYTDTQTCSEADVSTLYRTSVQVYNWYHMAVCIFLFHQFHSCTCACHTYTHRNAS